MRGVHSADLEPEILALGRRLTKGSRTGRFSPTRIAQDRAMAAMTADPGLRAAAFRLVDVAPACAGPAELAEHLAAYLDGAEIPHATVTRAAGALDERWLAPGAGRIAQLGVRAMADRFIVGETVTAAADELTRMWAAGCPVTVDLLGEATVTPEEGAVYARRCRETLLGLHEISRGWASAPLLEGDAAGPLPRVNLSVKVTALTPLIRPWAPERGRDDAAAPLRELLRTARELGAHLHIDMESYDSRELVLELALALLSEPEFADGPSSGVVLQAYLRDSEETLERILDWARAHPRPAPLTVRLVKGAYWDHEVMESAAHGWTPPVWTDKRESDRCYERLTRRLIDAFPLVRPAIASHNVRSVAHAVVYARHRGLAAGDLELQILRGLGDDLQRALAAQGLRCRAYCPVGDMVAGMAYLVRRLLENTSNDSFLTSQAAGADIEELMACP